MHGAGNSGRTGLTPSAPPAQAHAYAQQQQGPLEKRQQSVPLHSSQWHRPPPVPPAGSSSTMNASTPYAHQSQQQRAQYDQVQQYKRGAHDPQPHLPHTPPAPPVQVPSAGSIHGYQTGTLGSQHVSAQKVPHSGTVERTIGPSGRALVFPLRPLPPPLRKQSTTEGRRLQGAECYQHGSNSFENMGVARGHNVPRFVGGNPSELKSEHHLPASRGTGSEMPHANTPAQAEAHERMLVDNHRDAHHRDARPPSLRVSFCAMGECARACTHARQRVRKRLRGLMQYAPFSDLCVV